MTICKYCGFDDEEESLISEGSPCGIKGCISHFCCYESWEEHCAIFHVGWESD